MRIAVVAEVHENVRALRAVVDDRERVAAGAKEHAVSCA